jgi:hypothetical protein
MKIESVGSPQNTDRGTAGAQIYLITQSLKDVMTMDQVTLMRRICQAQEELLLLMTSSYEAFLESSNFEEYEISMKDQERKTYDQKHISTRNTTSFHVSNKSSSSNSITVLSQSAILKQTDIIP